MSNGPKYFMLVDDDVDDNYIHERAIIKNNSANVVITKNTAMEALKYLKSAVDINVPKPDVIFLDIMMPLMNGWEFLDEYNLLDKELQCPIVVIMLAGSQTPVNTATKAWGFVSEYTTKPLTTAIISDIVRRYLND